MIGKSNLLVRNAIRNFVRHHNDGGAPGANLPFSIKNRFRLTLYFIAFFGSGFAAPFLVVRHQLLKQ